MERGSIYPSWRFHPTFSPVLCLTAEQDAELGDDWADSPAAFIAEPEPIPDAVDESDPHTPEDAPKKRGRKPKAA